MDKDKKKKARRALFDSLLDTVYDTKNLMKVQYYNKTADYESAYNRIDRLITQNRQRKMQMAFLRILRLKGQKFSQVSTITIQIMEKLKKGKLYTIVKSLREFAQARMKIEQMIEAGLKKTVLREIKDSSTRFKTINKRIQLIQTLIERENKKLLFSSFFTLINRMMGASWLEAKKPKNFNIGDFNEITHQSTTSPVNNMKKPMIQSTYSTYQYKTPTNKERKGNSTPAEGDDSLANTIVKGVSNKVKEKPKLQTLSPVNVKSEIYQDKGQEEKDQTVSFNNSNVFQDKEPLEKMKSEIVDESLDEPPMRKPGLSKVTESKKFIRNNNAPSLSNKTDIPELNNNYIINSALHDKKADELMRQESRKQINSVINQIQNKLIKITSTRDLDFGNKKRRSISNSFVLQHKSFVDTSRFQLADVYSAYYIKQNTKKIDFQIGCHTLLYRKSVNYSGSPYKQPKKESMYKKSPKKQGRLTIPLNRGLNKNFSFVKQSRANLLAPESPKKSNFKKMRPAESKPRFNINDLQNFSVLLNFFITRRIKIKQSQTFASLKKTMVKSIIVERVRNKLDRLFVKKKIRDFRSASLFQTKKINTGHEVAFQMKTKLTKKLRYVLRLLRPSPIQRVSSIFDTQSYRRFNKRSTTPFDRRHTTRVVIEKRRGVSIHKQPSNNHLYNKLEQDYFGRVNRKKKKTISYYSTMRH